MNCLFIVKHSLIRTPIADKEEETKLKTREHVGKEQRLQKAIELKRLWREERSGKEKEEEEV